MLTDVRTDERTNGQKLARLCLPAKAGATTRGQNHFLTIDKCHNSVINNEICPLTFSSETFLIQMHMQNLNEIRLQILKLWNGNKVQTDEHTDGQTDGQTHRQST